MSSPTAPLQTLPVSQPKPTTSSVDPPKDSQYLGNSLIPSSVSTILPDPIIPASSASPLSSLLAQDPASVITEDNDPASPATQPASVNGPGVIAVGGQSVNADSRSGYIIGTQTLVAGGAITVLGTPFSFPVSSPYVIVGTSKTPIESGSSATLPQALTFGGNTYTANSLSVLVIGSQTIVPGGPAVTISGSQISLGALQAGVDPTPTFDPKVLTFAGQTFTESSASEFVIGTQTLVSGGALITVSGTPLSLAADPTDVVIGTSTQGLAMSGFERIYYDSERWIVYRRCWESVCT